jgi:ribonuclease D
VLSAVRSGLNRDPKALPPTDRGIQISSEGQAALELFKVLLKAVSAQHGVAPKLIATSEDLERLASEKEPDVAALKGWRFELFGEQAMALKAGRLALTLKKGGGVQTVSMSEIAVT